jgi:predicted outer membrane protein
VRELATRLVRDHESSLKTIRTWADGRALQIAALDADANEQAGTGGSGSNQAPTAIPQTSAKGAQKATEWTKEADQKREELSREEPGKFDKEFLSQVIESQEEGKELLKQGRKDFEGDTTLAAVLAKNQPVLDAHVAQAKSLKEML